VLGIWWRGLTSVGAACGLAVGGVASGVATTLAITGGIDDRLLGGWAAAVVGYPAAVTVPLAFLVMVVVSRVTASSKPPDVARIFARMHVPERLGMGVERLPRD
jgi:Na+(H+)/acetate symporter ActP